MYRNVYAQRSSRPDVGLPKKEGNDRISSRLSRAYWPFQPLLHHPALVLSLWTLATPLLLPSIYLYSLSVGGLLLEWFHMKRGLIFTLWWPSTYILYDLIILLLLLCTNIVYVTYFVSSNWPNGTTNQVLYSRENNT